MIATRTLLATAFAASLLFSLPGAPFAEEPVVKAAATDPTKAAAENFCGDPSAPADELAKRYMAMSTLQKIDTGETTDQYVTYSDDPKTATVMYNFSTDKNPAHPVAVCRKLARDGDELTLKYNVVCGGSPEACAKAASDFNVLIARQQAAINSQIEAAKGK